MAKIQFRRIDVCERCGNKKCSHLAYTSSLINTKIKLLCEDCLKKVLVIQNEELLGGKG